MQPLKRLLRHAIALLAVVLFCTGCSNFLPAMESSPWRVVHLPIDENLMDLGFSDAQHGWLVGANVTLLETTDGGNTWQPRQLDLGNEIAYRFSAVSFSGNEGWIVGQPSILLHTDDAGQSWSRIPLSEKLPGSPNTVLALGPKSAEMTTDIGAIYRTSDGGKTWKAMVEAAVGVVRNISRSPDGKYVAVSSRGSFYSTWEPGQTMWQPHNRNSSRRVQNMGYTQDGRLWMLARGGQVQFTSLGDVETWEDAITPEFATSWGLLDLAYRTPDEIWVSGGSGNLLRTLDGGKTWEKDETVENVPSNFYKIIFLKPDQGFIIGQRGILLKYEADSETA